MFVKICGITSEEDALVAVAMGADAVGFIFAPSSRQMSPLLVGTITRRLPPEVLTVGVFRDSDPRRVVEVAGQAGVRAVQLHGDETPEDCAEVAEHIPLVIKGFRAGHPWLAKTPDYRAQYILLDADEPGSGKVFDWRLVENVPRSSRLILAGGLNPGNVAGAIARVRPFGVDVSTGVEQSPGRKDPKLIREFVQAVRAVPEPERYQASEAAPYDWAADEWGS
jgi:phosphoribosylanthranilate isomerase